MEKNIAILIADLSGYTALTEAHGASTAAETVQKYRNLVLASLSGNSTLHECMGDEVMIVSDFPDDLINSAINLIINCSKENYFPQIHGALHYGKVLKHNNHYFGSPVNQTARIAGKANKGAFWCSSTFINVLSNPSAFGFSSKGKHSFKNVSGKIEVYEIIINNILKYHVDPVCRMLIHNTENAIPHPDDKGIFFCSPHCLKVALEESNTLEYEFSTN